MDIEQAIYERRTIRRFKQTSIPMETLKKLIDLARVAPMARNIQAMEFIIVQNNEHVKKIFSMIRFAGSLPENERKPEPGREPTTYIMVMVNTDIKKEYVDFDVGAAVENILLGAVKYGIGCCWMGNIDKNKIQNYLKINQKYEIKHVISLGYPDEVSVMEPFQDSFKYWKDDEGGMHVPKRTLEDIIKIL